MLQHLGMASADLLLKLRELLLDLLLGTAHRTTPTRNVTTRRPDTSHRRPPPAVKPIGRTHSCPGPAGQSDAASTPAARAQRGLLKGHRRARRVEYPRRQNQTARGHRGAVFGDAGGVPRSLCPGSSNSVAVMRAAGPPQVSLWPRLSAEGIDPVSTLPEPFFEGVAGARSRKRDTQIITSRGWVNICARRLRFQRGMRIDSLPQ